MARPYEGHDVADLRALLSNPLVGDVQRHKIRVELAARGETVAGTKEPAKAKPAPGSTAVGVMNKTEAAHARRLDADPDVAGWQYEEIKVRSGVERSWLTPDFFVHYKDGSKGFDEVKGGHIREDARAKFQAAAKLHPWARWRLWQKSRGGEWRLVHDYPAKGPSDE